MPVKIDLWPPLPKDVSQLRFTDGDSRYRNIVFALAETSPRRPKIGEYFIDDMGEVIFQYMSVVCVSNSFNRIRWIVVPAKRKPFPFHFSALRAVKSTLLSGERGCSFVRMYLDQLEKLENGF
jgi:hypothetical protein